MRPEEMVRTCVQRGITVLAVTDHNQIEGSWELQAIAPFKVIPGEEVRSWEGELIGYFLQELIPKGLTAEETARRIREQGGVVNVPHPFDSHRGGAVGREVLSRLVSLGLVDMIEGFNARMTTPAYNDEALEYAREAGLPVTAGSDAHTYAEIGTSYLELRPFDGPQEFISAVRDARLTCALSPWPVHLASTWAKVAKRLQR